MKKIVSFLLACSIFVTQSTYSHEDSSISEKRVEPEVNSIQSLSQVDLKSVDDLNKVSDKKELSKEKVQKNVSTELVEKKITDLEEYQENFEGQYQRLSKWEMAKNLTKYFANVFVNDIKNYIRFYPLSKIAQFICALGWFLPSYALYKKTGIDVPGKVSEYLIKHQNFAIFAQNLYNVIPMTLASFMLKYAQEAYWHWKNYY